MATRKIYVKRAAYQPPRGAGGRRVAQTVRLTDDLNKRLHRAAKKNRLTFNLWAVTVLAEAADKTLTRKKEHDGEAAGTSNTSE